MFFSKSNNALLSKSRSDLFPMGQEARTSRFATDNGLRLLDSLLIPIVIFNVILKVLFEIFLVNVLFVILFVV